MADKNDEIRVHPLATFPVEAEEHLQALTANLLALERGLPDEQAREVLETIFREGGHKSDDGETHG
jgi:chemotaxis protein histidine kinase CheA